MSSLAQLGRLALRGGSRLLLHAGEFESSIPAGDVEGGGVEVDEPVFEVV